MSIIFGMQREDLIGATIVDVDGRNVDEDLFDLENITLELLNHKIVSVAAEVDFEQDGEIFSGVYLNVQSSSNASSSTLQPSPTYNEHQHRASLKNSLIVHGIDHDGTESIEDMEELIRSKYRSPPYFDHLPKQIDEMSYNELRRLERGHYDQTSDEFHACLAARDYMRSDPPKFEKEREAERARNSRYTGL